MNIYQEHGYESRDDYLQSLADDYGVSFSRIKLLADTLGEREDFDGLVSNLDSYGELLGDMLDNM